MKMILFSKLYLSPTNGLGLLRILFFGYLFIFYSQRSGDVLFFNLAPQHWRQTFWFEFFSIPKVDFQTAQWFWKTWMLSLLFSSLGLFYRVSSLASAFLGWYILNASASTAGDEFLWNYSNALPILWMLTFSFSKANDSYSVDNLIFKKPSIRDNFDFIWPLQLMRVLFVFPFFFSAFHRISQNGISFFQSDQLLNLVSVNYSSYCMGGATFKYCDLVSFFIQYPKVISIMYDFSQVIELCTVLMLFSRFSRWLILPGLIGMQ
jgi:hypothetical protein